MGLHCLNTSFIDRPFLKMIYLSMVYQHFAQAPPEKHQLVRSSISQSTLILFVLMGHGVLDFGLTITLRAFMGYYYKIVRPSTLPSSSLS